MAKKIGNDDENSDTPPRTRGASFLSRLCFWWTLPIFLKRFKHNITEEDLFAVQHNHEARHLGNILENLWNLHTLHHKHPSLGKILWHVFGRRVTMLGALLFFMEFAVKLPQSLAIWKLMTYYESDHKAPEDVYLYVFLIILTCFVHVICYHYFIFTAKQAAMMVRVAVCSLIYRKTLKLSKSARGGSIGQIVNLVANDVKHFEKLLMMMHYLWIAPLQITVTGLLLYSIISPIALVGILVFIIFVFVQVFLGRIWSHLRLQIATRTDERVRLINEVISGINIIKMYTWERFFIKLVSAVRKREIFCIKMYNFIKAFHISFNKYVTRLGVFLFILIYVLTGNHIHAKDIFVAKSFFMMLKDNVTNYFPSAVENLTNTLVSIKRIQEFLMEDELNCTISNKLSPEIAKSNILLSKFVQIQDCGVYLRNVSTKWCSSGKETLSNITLKVSSGQLGIITGAVGSGKTTLLNFVLGEVPFTTGTKNILGTVSFASQKPWLYSGTIKDNILFGQKCDVVRYNEVIKVCALEKDLDLLPFGDNTLIGERGITLSGGQKCRINLARAVYKDADIYLLDDPLSAVDSAVGKQLFQQCILSYLNTKCVLLTTHQIQYLKDADQIFVLKNGKMAISESYKNFENCNGKFLKDCAKNDDREIADMTFKNEKPEKPDGDEPAQEKEYQEQGSITLKVYGEYVRSGGGIVYFVLIMSLFVISQLVVSVADIFEALWVNVEEEVAHYSFLTKQTCLYIYAGLIVTIIVTTVIRCISYFLYFIRGAENVHTNMFLCVIHTTLNFFNKNPSGRVLNRFCKDMGTVDEILPILLMDTIQIALNVVAISIVVAIVSPWMLMATAVMFVLFYKIRRAYLLTNRDIKRMEVTSRSPIYSHLNASLEGLETIRAFGVQKILKNQFDDYQNKNTKAFYSFLGCTSAFGFWLDLICSVYISIATVSSFWRSDDNGAYVGLTITQSLGLMGAFQWGIKQWSELETEMVSMERIMEYMNLQPEQHMEKESPPLRWPQNYKIQFKSVSLRYNSDEPYAIRDLSFLVNSKQKIGIIGRTGAGKSSILTTLFRLCDYEGTILIDDVNISNISLLKLRSKISIIPQEPVLFSGTIRENLDPFTQHIDCKLWSALEQVELKSYVGTLPKGLQSPIFEGGSNLSVGQRQLICLARALLRENNILVLDEATANIDFATDLLIQSLIRKRFVDSTVIIIAHRLYTVMDCDKILVMDAGRGVEFDHPYNLLQNRDSTLYKLVAQTGNMMFDKLRAIAEKSYKNKSE